MKSYLDKPSRQKKNAGSRPGKRSGKLSKDGRIFTNDLLDLDLTSQRATIRKLK